MTLDATDSTLPWTVLDANGIAADQSHQLLPLVLVTRSVTPQPVQTDISSNGVMTIPSNDGRVIIEIQNTSGSQQSARFYQPNAADGVLTGGRQVTIAAGTTVFVGPFPRDAYNWNDNTILFSGTGTLKYRVLRPL